MFKPVELEIELFCRGVRIDPSCEVEEDARRIARTRAGLGSGLELVIPSPKKKIWAITTLLAMLCLAIRAFLMVQAVKRLELTIRFIPR